MIQKKLQKTEKTYRIKAPPDTAQVPDRLPDVFVNIDKNGLVYGGKKIHLQRGDQLFDYVASKCGVRILKKAMGKAGETTPQDVEVHFKYQGGKSTYLCRIHKFNDMYLIGGWRLPENLIHFPNKDTAA